MNTISPLSIAGNNGAISSSSSTLSQLFTTPNRDISNGLVSNNSNESLLMILPNGPSSFTPSLRKFRHLKSIFCRNLQMIPAQNNLYNYQDNDRYILPSTYFTLHAPPFINISKLSLQNDNEYDNDEDDNNNNNNEEEEEEDEEGGGKVEDQQQEDIDQQDNNNENVNENEKYNNKNNDNQYDIEYEINEYDYNSDDEFEDLPPPFYTSELIPNSNNPNWNPFDCYRPLPEYILEKFNSFNICIWDDNNEDEPIYQTDVDLTLLEFICSDIKQFVNLTLPANSIIFELKDGFYVTREIKMGINSNDLLDYKFNQSQPQSTATSSSPSSSTGGTGKKPITGNQTLFLCVIAKRLQNMATIRENKILEKKIEDKLKEHSEFLDKVLEMEVLTNRVNQLREEYFNQKNQLEKDKNAIIEIKKDFIPRATSLTNSGIVFYSSYLQLLEDKKLMEMDQSILVNLKSSLEKKKWHLLSQIRTIYPIQQGNKALTINNLPLPHSDFNGYDEENIATALGYVCHILFLASKYLEIPLRYPMSPMASRSYIKDEISHFSSSKFPLYSKGVEKRIFDYAVFLLNKNLEQLLNSQGLNVFKLKETLPNIQILLGRSRIV